MSIFVFQTTKCTIHSRILSKRKKKFCVKTPTFINSRVLYKRKQENICGLKLRHFTRDCE